MIGDFSKDVHRLYCTRIHFSNLQSPIVNLQSIISYRGSRIQFFIVFDEELLYT